MVVVTLDETIVAADADEYCWHDPTVWSENIQQLDQSKVDDSNMQISIIDA